MYIGQFSRRSRSASPRLSAATAITGSLLALTALWLALPPHSFAEDPVVPTDVRPLELLHQYPAELGLRLGIFDVHPIVSAGLLYDDNIQLSANHRQSDFIGSLSPELLAEADRHAGGVGTYFSLDYRPTLNLFAVRDQYDNFGQYARVSARWDMTKLTLGVAQTYTKEEDASAEVGRRVRRNRYETDLTSHYALNDLMSFDINPRLSISDNGGLVGSREWAVDAFLNRIFAAKLTAGVGGSVGYVESSSPNPAQKYERALGRLTYALAAKVDVTATAGGEWRQFTSGLQAFAAVLGISATYRPWERTSLMLEAHRNNEVSLQQVTIGSGTGSTGEDDTASGFTAEIRQQFWDRYFVSLAGSYENRSYFATLPGMFVPRKDDYWLLRITGGATWFRNLTVGLFYQYQANDSTDRTHRLGDNQVGLNSSVVF